MPARSAPADATTPAIPDSIPVMPPIIVTAKRPDFRSDIVNRPGFVAMVDMSQRRDRVEDLPAILSQLVGVRVTQYGGMGSFATVSIRGSSSSQVRTFLDGIPIDDPYLGVTNIADLPLGGVDRVEVYRGFSPPSLGAAAVGGAVQLVSRMEGTHDALLSGVEANASAGSFETRREAISFWLKPGQFRFFGHGTHESSAGDFEFVDDNGTQENPDDDHTTARVNNDFDAWSGILRGSAEVPGVGTALLGYYDAARNNGVPGLGSNQSGSARSERRRRLGQLRIDGAPRFDDRLVWTAAGFYHRANEQFHDPDGEIALTAEETDNTINAYGGTARLKYLIPGNRFSVEANYSATTEQFHPVETLPAQENGPDRWRRTVMIALGGDAYLIGQSLVVSGLFRYEKHADEFGDETDYPWLPPSAEGRFEHETTSPSAGARWHARPWLTLKGNIGRYYRLPTFLELFGNTGSVTGNAALEPEEGVNRDAGFTVNVGHAGFARALFAEVSYFDNTVDNLILFWPNSQWTTQPSNIGAAHIRGIESSVSAALPYQFDVSAAYTFMDAEDTGNLARYRGKDLPSRPRHDFNGSLSYSWHALRATYELHYISANYLDRYNATLTDARDLHSLILTLRAPVDGLSLSLEGRNLGDVHTEDVAGFPLPGRSVYSTLGYRY
ncbi:MAG TPA: TonB-dependent receptor [Candidatus Krumholzibacteria bacterium]|nr:TonB-dependent receptor [Candidatus Krumholzibacteria bacterium]